MTMSASRLKWRKDNSERIKFLHKRYDHEHREQINAYRKEYRKRNPEKFRDYYKKWYEKQNLEEFSAKRKISRKKWKKNNSISNRYSIYHYAAKSRKYSFEITKELFESIITSPCYYCGFSETKVGVDRKDNTLGYTTENCLPCCKDCNRMKGALPFSTFLELCRKITENRE